LWDDGQNYADAGLVDRTPARRCLLSIALVSLDLSVVLAITVSLIPLLYGLCAAAMWWTKSPMRVRIASR